MSNKTQQYKSQDEKEKQVSDNEIKENDSTQMILGDEIGKIKGPKL